MKIICYFCGAEFEQSDYQMRVRAKAKYLPDIYACKLCVGKKLALINSERARLGVSAAQGRVVSEEEKIRAAEKRRKNPAFINLADRRRGKSLVEFYGEKGAQNVVDANKRQAELRRQTGRYPHSGIPHSKETRAKQSSARFKVLQDRPELSLQHGICMRSELPVV